MKKHVLRTSDLAHRIGVQPEAIRYYEQRGLLPPPQRAASGYRIYTPNIWSASNSLRNVKRSDSL
jgi:MerR family mercuric resistance operon transcriptional regulator